jgi:hypothetical protein
LADPFSFVREPAPRHGAVVRSRLKSRRGTVGEWFLPPLGDARMPSTGRPRGSAGALTGYRCAGPGRSTLVLQVFFAEAFRNPRFMLPEPDFRPGGSSVPARYREGMRARLKSDAKRS